MKGICKDEQTMMKEDQKSGERYEKRWKKVENRNKHTLLHKINIINMIAEPAKFAKALTHTHDNPMLAFLALAVTLSCVHHKGDKRKFKCDRGSWG